MPTTPSSVEFFCKIRNLAGDIVEQEPEVGRWYLSVDHGEGRLRFGATARYLGAGDFLSNGDDYFDDACGIFTGNYLQLLRL